MPNVTLVDGLVQADEESGGFLAAKNNYSDLAFQKHSAKWRSVHLRLIGGVD
jgi:hypothetical protein